MIKKILLTMIIFSWPPLLGNQDQKQKVKNESLNKKDLITNIEETNSSELKNTKEDKPDIFNSSGLGFFNKSDTKNFPSTQKKLVKSVNNGPISGLELKALVNVSTDNFFAVLSFNGKDYFVRKDSKLQIYSSKSNDLFLIQNVSADGVELFNEDLDKSYMVQ